MKITFLSIALVFLVVISGCDKEKEAAPVEQPISAFLADSVDIRIGTRSSGPWELGIAFSSSVAGKITQLGSKMPDPGVYRVLLWDFDSKLLLRQKNVEQNSPGVLTLSEIEPVDLLPNKKYVISINSGADGSIKRYFFVEKKNYSSIMPFSKGSILVYNSQYSSTATAVFPNTTNNERYEFYGFPEFTFRPD